MIWGGADTWEGNGLRAAPDAADVFVRADGDGDGGAGGGGAGVFPPVGKVRAPESYGPTGTEYVGTETLPAEAEVQTGVGYGAGGTEFTGSLAAGGGSRGLIGG